MQKLKVLVDGLDIEYFNRLKNYITINNSHIIKITHNKEEAHFLITDSKSKDNIKIVVNEDSFEIYKFQKASLICSQILERVTNEHNCVYNISLDETRLITVTSPLGGSGKTTVSQALCIEMAKYSKCILYIAMDALAAGDCVFNSNSNNDFSKIRYYIKKKDNNLGSLIEINAGYDEINNVYYISKLYPSCDLFMSEKEMDFFIEKLKGGLKFDYVIFDVPSYLTRANIKLMELSYQNVIVLKNGLSKRQQQFKDFINEYEISNTIEFQHIPTCENIFSEYPKDFWVNISKLANKIAGGNIE